MTGKDDSLDVVVDDSDGGGCKIERSKQKKQSNETEMDSFFAAVGDSFCQ